MSKRVEHILAGLGLLAALGLTYSDGLMGKGYIFTEVIQDITNLYGFYEWDNFSASRLNEGYFPLWNPHNGLGVPHLANMQSAIFYPLNWLKFASGFWPAIDWILIARLWLAGFFLYLFARRGLGLKAMPAFFSGLSFELCGYFMRYVYMSHLNVECLLPLQLLCFHWLSKERKLSAWLWSGFSIYLLVSGGFPEAGFYAIGFASIYFLFGTRARSGFRASLVLLISVLAFGLLLASTQWLPFYEYLGRAWTYHQGEAGARHLDLAYAISLLLPWFFGKNLESTLVPFIAPGLGAVALILAFRAALETRKEPRRTLFWLVSAIFLLGLIYGIPPFKWLSLIYPFSASYNFKYAVPVLSLCVSLLAGIGFEKFPSRENIHFDLLAVGAAWAWASANLMVALLDGFRPFYGFGIAIEMMRLALVSAMLLLVITLSRSRALPRASAALIVLAALGSIYFDHYCNRGTQLYDYLTEQSREAGQLKNVFNEPYRYSAEGDILFPDQLLPIGVDDLRSYDPLYPREYVYFMATINGLESEDAISRHYNAHKLFQIDRDHLRSSLVPLANLVLYSADYELDSLPLAGEILKKGVETGEFAGWSRSETAEIAGVSKKSLLMHSRDRLEADLSFDQIPAELLFDAAVLPVKGKFAGSGGQLQVLLDENGQARLAYSRFLDPSKRLDDQFWRRVSIKFVSGEKKIRLALIGLSGPSGSAGEYIAWAGLRVRCPRLEIPGVKNWTEKGEISLNYLKDSYPRYFLAQSIGVIPSKNFADEFQKFRVLNDAQPGFFRNQAVVSGQLEYSKSKGRLSGESWVKVFENRPEEERLELKATEDCFLVASEQYFPGWRVKLDGVEQRIYRADLAVRTIFIPAGRHDVRFWYQPRSFSLGLWTTVCGLTSLIILAGLSGGRKPGRVGK